MARSFKVVIVTPDRTAFEGDAVAATIPGQEGYLGVWANHAPLVAGVSPGVVTLRTDDAGSETTLAVGAGFVEISNNVVNLMTDTCELAGEIDMARAQKALERARQRLVHVEEHLDRERARLAQARAQARLKVARRH